MTDKYEGASKICTNCNSVITCRMTNYKEFENKLQWQNKDGGAHYIYKGKDVDGKPIFECQVVPLVTSSSTKLTKKDYIQCPMCPEHIGWMIKKDTVKLKKHIQAYHPNNERLSIEDFKLGTRNKSLMQNSYSAKTEKMNLG